MKKMLFNKLFIAIALILVIIFGSEISVIGSENSKTNSIKQINKKESVVNDKKFHSVSNSLFSIELPNEIKNLYVVQKKNNGIFIYDKESKQAGFGGLTFGVKAYKRPSEHAQMPGGKKLGELVDKNNVLYDIVLIRPTDVQYDYANKKSESYDKLFDLGNTINAKIKGVNKSKYIDGQGMKGEDLYKDILQKHVRAIKEKWDSEKLEKEDMSYMYNAIASSSKNALDVFGYAYYDANADGIDELFIGEISEDNWKGIVYDIYTMVERKPAHVVSGGIRDRYFVCDDTFICNEYSSGAKESGWLVFALVENSTELFPQVGFKYDGYEDEKNPWFISYNFLKNEWKPVSEKDFDERKSTFDKYERFNYKPLSSLKY